MVLKSLIRRKKYLIKGTFQFKFAAVIVFAILLTIALVGWDVYYTIGMLLMEKGGDPYLLSFVKSFNALLLKKLPLLLVFITFLSIFISHEISGPVYHLEKSLRKVKDGDFNEHIKLRKGDELKDLAIAFNEMTGALRNLTLKNNEKIKKISEGLDSVMGKLKKEILNSSEINEINSEINKIKNLMTEPNTMLSA